MFGKRKVMEIRNMMQERRKCCGLAGNSASYGRRQTYVWSRGLWGYRNCSGNDVLGMSGAQAEIFMSWPPRVVRVEMTPEA